MKKLFAHLSHYKKECILAPLLKCLEALVDLFVPLCMANLVDIGIKNNDTGYIFKIGVALLLLALGGLVLSVIAQYFAAKAATGVASDLRHALFAHIQSLSFQTQDTLGTDTLITRLTSDINQTQTGINMALRLLLRSPFIVFGAMIMAFRVDAPSAVTFAITIPVLAVIVYGIMWITVPLYKKVQQRLDKVVGSTRQNLTGVRVIRAFNLEDSETEEFHASNEALTAANVHVGRFSALTNPLTLVVVNLAAAYLLYIGAIRVDAGELSQGQVIALLNYMAQILVELVKLANLIITITKAVSSAGRIETILNTEPGMQDGTDTQAPADNSVVFDNVSFEYAGGGDEVLTDISFEAAPGQTIGIIGGTGSGKSSLVNLIPRFYDVTSGRLLVGGKEVQSYDLQTLRGSIGAVLQKAVLFKGTIRENLAFGNESATEADMWDAINAAQAAEFVNQKGLDFELEQGGKNLSGGQRQRLGIARALVRKPGILILDDSASALDFATDAALRKAIHALPYHPTIFIVSQRVASIMYADEILVLQDGMLVGRGKHDELLQTCETYRDICKSQFKEEEVKA